MLSIFDIGPPPACPAPFNHAAHVLGRVAQHPDKIALEVLNRDGSSDRWSFADLQGAVLSTARGLAETGLVPGDIVLLRLGNTVDFPIAYLGAIAAGMVPVPTSTQLTAAETAAMIDMIAPAAVLHDPVTATAPHPRTIDIGTLRDMRIGPQAQGFQMGDPERLG